MKKAVMFLLCISLMGISSALLNCSDDEGIPPEKPKPGPALICPLAIGNTWNYTDTLWMHTNPPQAFGSSIEIVDDTLMTVGHADYHAYMWREVDNINYVPTTLLVANESDGLWELGIWCNLDSLYFMNQAAMFPAVVGDNWIKAWYGCAVDYSTMFPPDTTRCISVDSVVTTPAGTFTCYVYHEHYNVMLFGDYDFYKYYAPRVGLVGLDAAASGMHLKRRLTSYTLR